MRKLSYSLFGTSQDFGISEATAILYHSTLPKNYTEDDISNLKLNNKFYCKKDFFNSLKKVDNKYYIDKNIDIWLLSNLANCIIYTSALKGPNFDGFSFLILIYNIAYYIIIFSIIIFSFKKKNIKSHQLIWIPFFYIFISQLFFGSSRYILPSIPFVILYFSDCMLPKLRKIFF